ncbi:V(D)J recombination-activating protein 1-like [Ptychodera flava]|uniref:V(D)J recombination-activating protein 1-like n=1 Tax=Ptychodera flava TaxID=63121 RepID=UPI00396A77C4
MPVEVLTFRPHSNENCSVCMACQSIQPTSPDIKVGRPPKRKRGGFSGGQGTGQRQTVQQTLQREQDRSVEELPSTSSDVTIQRGSGGSEPTVESVRRKLLMIESVEESNDDDVRVSTEISSIPIERFVERDIAEHFVCCICQGVPTSPSMSSCDHIFCTGCIDQWLKNSSACPSCREVVESTDLDKLTGNTLNVYDSLRLQCVFHDLGCSTTCSLSDHKEHEKNCAFKGKGKRSTYGKKRVKQPLRTADKQYCKQKRLKPCYDFLNEFCAANVESKEDVLFFLLRSHLFDSSDRERAKLIDDIWSNMQSTMNVHECLTYRVDNLQTKNQYKAQYDKLKDKTIGVLLPPSQLDECEKRYMPGTTRYAIVGEDHHEHIYTTQLNSKEQVKHKLLHLLNLYRLAMNSHF